MLFMFMICPVTHNITSHGYDNKAENVDFYWRKRVTSRNESSLSLNNLG